MTTRIGIINVSDRASAGVYEDTPGKAVVALLEHYLTTPFEPVYQVLSRQTAGVRGGALILNLPGRPRAIEQCLEAVFPAIPYCIDLLGGPRLECDPAEITAFRPKGA